MDERFPAPGLAAYIGFELPDRYNAARLLWDNLATNADRPAIFCDTGMVTYGDLIRDAARIGNTLRATGAAPGDRVLLFMDDEPVYPAAIMGAMRAGLVPVLINTLSPADAVRFFLQDSGATTVVASSVYRSVFSDDLLAGTDCRTVLIAPDLSRSPDLAPWSHASSDLREYPTSRKDMAFWMYSSGSTGRPKGVVHRHEDAAYTAATYARTILKLGPDDICFSIPKIFFAYGFGNSVTFPFSVGAASVLLSARPLPAVVFDQIVRYRPTVLFGLPTLYTALIRHELSSASGAKELADLSSVRLCISAAEILSADIAGAWKGRFGLDIVEGLGSTEMLHIYLSNDQALRKTASAGRVVPGYAVKLITPDGALAKAGEEGVMMVTGLSAAEQYWNRPEKTAVTMQDGWIHTGDRFVFDDDGFYFFKGRADDLVKVSGQWVYPLEIELALNDHPDVYEACVQAVAMADQRLTLKAWVVPAPGVAPDEATARSIQDHARRTLLPHKYPREVIFMESLPKTGTGKIDRQALRQGNVWEQAR